MGDAAEAMTMLDGGAPIRVLAVYHKARLPGRLAQVPTATEQGYPIEWPIIGGYYVGPKVSDVEYQWWVDAFKKTLAAPGFQKLQAQQGLFPLNLVGAELETYIKGRVQQYAQQAESFGLMKK
jgi:putative tricarboxylic transport membrane protein